MKIKDFIILAVAFVTLSQCGEKPDRHYSNEEIVASNALAALYFHTIFCEAENAWAVVSSLGYGSQEHTETNANTNIYKKVTFDESTNTATIEYNGWSVNHLLLDGSITVAFDTGSYRIANSNAIVHLIDFSIEGQTVTGGASIQYKHVEEDANDQYSFILFSDAIIYEKGERQPVLISASIAAGNYERIEGGETLSQNDDVWKYWGAMNGMIHENPNLVYENTVLSTYYDQDGEIREGNVLYAAYCKIQMSGVATITISERDDIIYMYGCTAIYFESETHNFR